MNNGIVLLYAFSLFLWSVVIKLIVLKNPGNNKHFTNFIFFLMDLREYRKSSSIKMPIK